MLGVLSSRFSLVDRFIPEDDDPPDEYDPLDSVGAPEVQTAGVPSPCVSSSVPVPAGLTAAE